MLETLLGRLTRAQAATFDDQVRAAAIPDGLLHPLTTIDIKGGTCEHKEKRKAGILATLPDASQTAAKKSSQGPELPRV